MRYMVMVADTWQVLARGFYSFAKAVNWADAHDWGQYELDGGLIIMAEVEAK